MSYFNQRFFKKTYLLEFKKGSVLQGAFGFSIPPQTEDFTYPQRVAETKTFGGSVFEDYGNDTINITLSGTTANNEFRVLYNGLFGTQIVKGEDEVFTLKKIIDRFGKVENLPDKVVTLYSLESKAHKYWNVVIKDLQIKRSKDNPMAYTYTLNCIGYKKTKKNIFSDIVDAVKELCDKIRIGSNLMAGWLEAYRTGLDLIATLNECVEEVESAINSYSVIASGFIDTTADYLTESAGLLKNTTDLPGRIILNAESNLYNSCNNLYNATVDFCNYIKKFPEESIYQDLLDRAVMNATDLKQAWLIECDDMFTASAKIKAEAKKTNNQNSLAVVPGNSDTSDSTVQVYGFKSKTVSDADSWDSLAYEYLGDANLSTTLAMYNLSKGYTLKAGNTIRIPVLNPNETKDSNNLIYAIPEMIDNYGIDIGLDQNGNLVASHGDLGTIKGSENLGQAINNRLSSEINSRIRLTVYGIRSAIGSVSEAGTYIVASIEETLMEDPRIKTIDSITFTGQGDNLQVSIEYTDINNDKQNFGGTI